MYCQAVRVPLHEIVRSSIRDRILSGELAAGDPLPSESELGTQFGASRGPVRQAIAALSAEGLILTSQGRVPVVAAAPLAQSIDDFFSFSSWVAATGRTPGQRTLEIALRRPSAEVAEMLELGPDEQAVELTRIRSIDGEPAMIERTAFAASVGRLLFDLDTDAGSLFEMLISHGVPLDRGTHTIDAVAADDLDAAHLDVAPGTPLLRVRRVTMSDAGDVLEASDDRYRPDRATLAIHNSRTQARPIVARRLTSEGNP
jgi:GntR family transcriptional regulator